MLDRGAAHHPRGRLRLALLLLLLVLGLARPAGPVAAAEAACQSSAFVAAITAAPSDERVATLPPQFQPASGALETQRLLAEARRQVVEELRAVDAPDCYAAQVPEIASRTTFLSPFEFVVVGFFERDRAIRDELLRLYRVDPQQALRRAAEFWPSPRAELLIRTPAFFDIEGGQVFVNLGAVTPDTAPNVLAHEFWHALASVHIRTAADGALTRTTGFWTEQRAPGTQAWRPVAEEVAGGIPTYLMNEAVAIEMEVAATGRQHPGLRPDLAAAIDALHELFAVGGRERVLRLYLESRSDELKQIASEASVALGPRWLRSDAQPWSGEPHPCGPGCCCHATLAAHRA